MVHLDTLERRSSIMERHSSHPSIAAVSIGDGHHFKKDIT